MVRKRGTALRLSRSMWTLSLACSAASALVLRGDPAIAQEWELEISAGAVMPNKPLSGDGKLPSPGETFRTFFGDQSRRVSSWYFGDGASLLNEVNAALLVKGRITPLDPVLRSVAVQRENGARFGFRLRRRLNRRLSAEVAFDYDLGRWKMNSASLSGIEATRASLTSAWNGLMAPLDFFFASRSVTSTANINARGGRQIFTSVALNVHVKPRGDFVPYATLGGGLVSTRGRTPSAALQGNYRFSLPFPSILIPFDETDTVKLRYAIDHSVVGVIGIGCKYNASRRWGIGAGVRDHLTRNKTRNLLDASPAVSALSPPAGFQFSGGAVPALVFDNDPLESGRSTLSGPPITGFETFKGRGMQHNLSITAGLFLRF
jgi:hypothetical protein